MNQREVDPFLDNSTDQIPIQDAPSRPDTQTSTYTILSTTLTSSSLFLLETCRHSTDADNASLLSARKKVTASRKRNREGNLFSEHWDDLFNIRMSIVPFIQGKIAFLTWWSFLVCVIFLGVPGTAAYLPSSAMTFVVVTTQPLGLLVSFCLNNQYDRYWDGVKLWGTLQSQVLNLARLITIYFSSQTEEDQLNRRKTLKLLIGFAIAVKHQLRTEKVPPNFNSTTHNVPLDIITCLQYYLSYAAMRSERLPSYQILAAVSGLQEVHCQMDRIQSTPVPSPVKIHLAHCVFIYLYGIPFVVIQQVGWLTPVVSLMTAFLLVGITDVGNRIENPFGYDQQDLDIDSYCDSIRDNVQAMLARTDSAEDGRWGDTRDGCDDVFMLSRSMEYDFNWSPRWKGLANRAGVKVSLAK
ncbi:Bestrophin, RFP-TM, chloride channel-domain-containing protein [Chytriomyces cf. hyalinus JEL632]|nr:Bestrophin, RFP-TM, chloride channel-domain-containing protein [Chytriomyces cf. hyalinus JEL632]